MSQGHQRPKENPGTGACRGQVDIGRIAAGKRAIPTGTVARKVQVPILPIRQRKIKRAAESRPSIYFDHNSIYWRTFCYAATAAVKAAGGSICCSKAHRPSGMPFSFLV
jgi:hypothetical protein